MRRVKYEGKGTTLKRVFTSTGIRFVVRESAIEVLGLGVLCAFLAATLTASGASKEGVDHGQG
jgi:hypothetical protein